MKKLMGIVLAASMVLSMAACGSTADTASSAAAGSTADAEGSSNDPAASDLKVGVIILGDETEGYSAAHINGIKEAAAQKLGMSDQPDRLEVQVRRRAASPPTLPKTLLARAATLIISNSYGHQTYIGGRS